MKWFDKEYLETIFIRNIQIFKLLERQLSDAFIDNLPVCISCAYFIFQPTPMEKTGYAGIAKVCLGEFWVCLTISFNSFIRVIRPE